MDGWQIPNAYVWSCTRLRRRSKFIPTCGPQMIDEFLRAMQGKSKTFKIFFFIIAFYKYTSFLLHTIFWTLPSDNYCDVLRIIVIQARCHRDAKESQRMPREGLCGAPVTAQKQGREKISETSACHWQLLPDNISWALVYCFKFPASLQALTRRVHKHV